MDEIDQRLLRRTFDLARRARENGNQPFGALLAGPDRRVLAETMNLVRSEDDPTAHAEMTLLRGIHARFAQDLLARSTLYASTEPCPMCAGAIFWAGIGRVVFGLSTARLTDLAGRNSPHRQLPLPCRAILSAARPLIEVSGPVLQAEAAAAHEGFWDARGDTKAISGAARSSGDTGTPARRARGATNHCPT